MEKKIAFCVGTESKAQVIWVRQFTCAHGDSRHATRPSCWRVIVLLRATSRFPRGHIKSFQRNKIERVASNITCRRRVGLCRTGEGTSCGPHPVEFSLPTSVPPVQAAFRKSIAQFATSHCPLFVISSMTSSARTFYFARNAVIDKEGGERQDIAGSGFLTN